MNPGKQTPKIRRKTRKRHNPHRGRITEIWLKLILSWAIALGAIASVFRLLPYHLTQQAKLKELQIQVQETDARVSKLKKQLNYNFDPQRSQNLMEQYSSLTSPNESRIYWLEKEQSTE